MALETNAIRLGWLGETEGIDVLAFASEAAHQDGFECVPPLAAPGNEMASVFTTISSSASSPNAFRIRHGRFPSLATMYDNVCCHGFGGRRHDRKTSHRETRSKRRFRMPLIARLHLSQPPGGQLVRREERLQREL